MLLFSKEDTIIDKWCSTRTMKIQLRIKAEWSISSSDEAAFCMMLVMIFIYSNCIHSMCNIVNCPPHHSDTGFLVL